MFIEQHTHNEIPKGIMLTFLKSLNVHVYPCGRRRSELIDIDGNLTTTKTDKYHIPFDPEARLNTEYNNRHYSGLNGYTRSYVNAWDAEKNTFSFTISGYAFTIDLTERKEDGTRETISTIQDFAEKLVTSLEAPDCKEIYANIKLEEIPLYNRTDKVTEYNTWILRNQSDTLYASNMLDLLRKGATRNSNEATEYYFSGLSFSATPITEKVKIPGIDNAPAVTDKYIPGNVEIVGPGGVVSKTRTQHEFSLRILEKKEDDWQLYEPALLPRIEHGNTQDSLEVGHLNAKSLRCNNHPVAVFDVNPIDNNFYQLHLYDATQIGWGTIEPLIDGFSPITNAKANITQIRNNGKLSINFSTINPPPIGVVPDRWWVGFKIFAPSGATEADLKNTFFYPTSVGGSLWPEAPRSFWDEKDSAENAKRHFITLWLHIMPEMVEDATSPDPEAVMCWAAYQFDWGGRGSSVQTFEIGIDLRDVELIPKE